MPLKKTLIVSGAILALGALSYWAASTMFRAEATVCQVCARPVHAGQGFVVALTTGVEEHTCCPRCGLHFQMANAAHVQAAWATDYLTREKIDARRATYVEESDLMTCCVTPPIKRDMETSYELVWDRCLPSLIAFKTPAEATQFHQQHGGRVLTYAETVQSVKRR